MSLRTRIKGAWNGWRGKIAPSVGGAMSYGGLLGSTYPNPTKLQLIQQYRELVYACAGINAQAVSSVPLRLYATTSGGEPRPKGRCRPITDAEYAALMRHGSFTAKLIKALEVHEIEKHPLLDTLDRGNPFLHGRMQSELTQLYQEIEGSAYWYIEPGPLRVPKDFWILPSFAVTTVRGLDGLPKAYTYGIGVTKTQYKLEEIIAFRMPNLRDPYGDGYSPLYAVWESYNLAIDNAAYTRAGIEERGWLNTLVTPKEAIGADEADRMRAKLKKMIHLGKQGGPMVSESAFDLKQLQSMIDVIAVYGVAKETIANVFGVPMALVTKDTNLANIVAARQQHALLAVLPRCSRHEATLNQRLVPLYDERLFLAYDNPVPEDVKAQTVRRMNDLKMGVTTINEERARDRLEPVPWGKEPWIPVKNTRPGPGKPAPSPVPGQGTDKPAAEKVFDVLAALSCRDLTVSEATIRLVDLGYYPERARQLTVRTKLPAPRYCHHERATDKASNTWHVDPVKLGEGHQRELPKSPALESFLIETFNKQRREVLGEIRGKQCKDFWSGEVSLEKWNKYMAQGARPFVQVELADGLADGLARLGASEAATIWNVANPRVKDAIESLTIQFCETTNATTSMALGEALAKLRDEIAEGLLSTENTMPEMVRRVSAIFDQAEEFRAARIASTEASRALHYGQRLAAEGSGVVKGYKWLASADACEECLAIMAEHPDGIAMDGVFEDKGSGPYDKVQCPPAHCWCMCTMTEILGETNEGT